MGYRDRQSEGLERQRERVRDVLLNTQKQRRRKKKAEKNEDTKPYHVRPYLRKSHGFSVIISGVISGGCHRKPLYEMKCETTFPHIGSVLIQGVCSMILTEIPP